MVLNDFLENSNIDALLMIFANAKPNNDQFVVESSYSKSKYATYEITDVILDKTHSLMCEYFDLNFQKKGNKRLFNIDCRLSSDEFFYEIYRRIQQLRFEQKINDAEFSKKILLAFFTLRGSPDFNRNFYSVDLFASVATEKYVDLLFQLLSNLRDLRQLNLNFRELQNQYVTGEAKRNTQLRINLRYFYEQVGSLIEKVNNYKYDILRENEALILSKNISQQENIQFINRVLFYQNKILGKHQTEQYIEELRKSLGFVYDDKIDEKSKRNQSIVQYVRIYTPDECAACKQKYALSDRTFKYRNSERYYLEIHHCIAFSIDQTCDQIDNLVKLCPACHRALTKNRADETYQKELIKNIFINAPNTKQFCLNFVTEENCVDFVYERLS